MAPAIVAPAVVAVIVVIGEGRTHGDAAQRQDADGERRVGVLLLALRLGLVGQLAKRVAGIAVAVGALLRRVVQLRFRRGRTAGGQQGQNTNNTNTPGAKPQRTGYHVHLLPIEVGRSALPSIN